MVAFIGDWLLSLCGDGNRLWFDDFLTSYTSQLRPLRCFSPQKQSCIYCPVIFNTLNPVSLSWWQVSQAYFNVSVS
jgi:hypothetical protein